MRGRVKPVPAISLLGGACMSYTFSLSRRSLPVRCLCLLLIVLVLWCFFMVPRAGAVAVEAATVAYAGALVGTILVGAGVIFSSHGDMQKVGAAMYKSWIKSSNAIGSKISAIAAWAVEHGEAAAKGALRVGREMYQAIIDSFNADYDSGSLSFGGDFVGASRFVDSQSVASSLGQIMKKKHVKEFTFSGSSSYGSGRCFLKVDGQNLFVYMQNNAGTKLLTSFNFFNRYGVTAVSDYYFVGGAISSSYMYFYGGVEDSEGQHWTAGDVDISLPFTLSFPGCPVPNVLAPDLAYPSDNTLVRMPDIPSVDTDTGEAVFPSDAAYTKDAVSVPYPTDADGVKVPDIPYDKVVDQSTGKALDDTGTDTDNPSKPGEGTETGSNTSLLQKILDLLKNFFDSPSDFRLNMDGFRNLAIKDKFPFCIPFDMVDSVKQFAADAADYQFRVKLDTQYFKVDHVVDLTPLAVPLAFFRYLVVAWFAWVLMSRTHDLMKW